MPVNNENIPVTVEEIQTLRAEISQMHESLAKDVIGHAPLVKKIVSIFVNKGLDERWVEKLLAPLVGSSFESDEVLLLAYVLEELDNLLAIENESTKIEKKVHMVIGATGIGKTSLVGKLGARYKYLLEHSYKVAFINFDHYKVGAIEQLEHYADAMEIPLIEVDELVDVEYDIVLIDTAGSMGSNIDEIDELLNIIRESTDYKIEISLVLSATSRKGDLEHILNTFSSFSIQNFIFTKLDETNDLSDMLDFSIKHEIPIAYLSVGQVIPDDLMVGTKEYILNQFMKETGDE